VDVARQASRQGARVVVFHLLKGPEASILNLRGLRYARR
jgi:hypothetical protein